jgi:DNA-binding XRE family transcriptional regulator
METQNFVGEKIRIGREYLGMSQTQMAAQIGIRQTGISAMEVGMYERVAVKMLEFYAESGIDLGSMFNPNVTPEEFRKVCRHGRPKLLSGHVPEQAEPEGCQQCKVKEGVIVQLEKQITIMDRTIAMLEKGGATT